MNEVTGKHEQAQSTFERLLDDELSPLFWAPQRLGKSSGWFWLGHVPFAHWLVGATRPRLLVELGTHNGISYSAFCEANLRVGLPARCYAVDTWIGDEHTGPYSEDTYADLKHFNDQRYSEFSSLLRMTFDEALNKFEDRSIDLLHIDGLHTYNAVRHDFENWLPKLSSRAVVLFHDTNERQPNFGVWRLWAELRGLYPSFEFLHSHGLGILCVGKEGPAPLLELCAIEKPSAVTAIRERFEHLGQRWYVESKISHFSNLAESRRIEAGRLAGVIKAKQVDIGELSRELSAARAQISQSKKAISETKLELSLALAQQQDKFRSQLDAIYHSTSWRISAPIRALKYGVKNFVRLTSFKSLSLRRNNLRKKYKI